MIEPWEVFYTLYRELVEAGREDAEMKAAVETIYDWHARKERASGAAMAGLVTALNAWKPSEGTKEWAVLRRMFRDAWADYKLGT